MTHLVECPNHGYSQGSNRWGNSSTEKVETSEGAFYIQGGDRDCSSAIISVWEAVLNDFIESSYTADMVSGFTKTGLFEWLPYSYPQPGDILLKESASDGHTAMYIGNGQVAEFWLNEKGGIIGGVEGDQTGGESRIRDLYMYPWDGILRYIGGDDMTPGEFFNYEIPKASGGTMPTWQFFTWVTEHVASIFEYTYAIKTAVEKLAETTKTNAAIIARLEDIETLLINLQRSGSVDSGQVQKLQKLLSEAVALVKKL